MNVDAYLERIGYEGERVPSVPVLHALCEAHVCTVPFENLDVLLQRPMSIAADAVEDKLVRRRRGGYCFEHHTLLHGVLERLGFEARILAARARVGLGREEPAAPTHAFIGVQLEGETWLVDVGVGRASSTAALRFVLGEVQNTPHEPRRITRFGNDYMHEIEIGGRWEDVAQFSMRSMPRLDREVGHWYTSTHPDSTFRRTLMVARALPGGGRVALRDRRLRIRDGDQLTDAWVEDASALRRVLREHFGLAVDEAEVAALDRFLATLD